MAHRYQSPSEATPRSDAYHEGLEVAAPQHNNLEVHSPYDAPMPTTHSQVNQHPPANSYSNAGSAADRMPAWESKTLYSHAPHPIPAEVPVYNQNTNVDNNGTQRGKKIGFIVGAIAAVIIAGVVSGIIGWQVTENRNRDRIAALEAQVRGSSGGGVVNQNDTTGVRDFIQRGSSLSVTSWRGSNVYLDFEMRIYYQKPNGGNIFYSLYSTSYGAWSKPIEVGVMPNRDRRGQPPMEGTPLAATVVWTESGRPVPWDQVLYVTNEGNIAMQDWGPGYPLWGTVATTYTDLKNKVNKGGKMTYLWPHSVWEESNSGSNSVKLTHLIQDYKEKANFTTLTVEPQAGISPGTPIVALPMKKEFRAPELRLVYRTRDGNLGIFDRSAENKTREAVLSRIRLPDKAPIAGFASRPDDNPLVTTKLLYRDTDNRIQILTQRGGTGELDDTDRWEGPETDPVFDKMDSDSQLECLTNSIAKYGGVTRDVAESDLMSRCFFQEEGKLKQVHWDGRAWKSVGFVPMPAE
ncbi:hypothetical protein PspLS_10369 [Pyricularia sp. CBS 133598]|nr:hypothetical protein PspLS_10369 [Pyricularia sp. CBS 133598]